jgi:hypothetical protein
MSWETYDENCKGCQPAIIDIATGRPLPENSLEMIAVMRMWKTTTSRAEREAWHRVTCQNSRNVADLMIFQSLTRRIVAAMTTAKRMPV